MKHILFLLFALPLFVSAQKNDGYVISGTITGYPDGTVVDLLNGNNGAPEKTGKISDGKFELKGKVDVPDIKLLSFNKEGNYIPMFLDNSKVSVMADAKSLDRATVTGSKSHDEFKVYSTAIQPYQQMLSQQDVTFDEPTRNKGVAAMEGFLNQFPQSYVAPLAIYRIYQFTEDFTRVETLFSALPKDVQGTPVGQFLSSQIAESKINQVGSVMEDFTQADTTGKPFKLSSLRGKYVLVDFWASWCRPCRDENPNVVNAYQKYKNKNFTVLGVSLDKSRQPWMDAIYKDQLTWPHVSDLKGWQNAVAQQFKIYSIPQNLLIGPDGKIIAKNLRGAALGQKLAEVIK